MTALGKILVFVVLLLALIWNGLVVNAYVTRVNWKTELEKVQKKLAEASEAASGERKASERSEAASLALINQLREENSRLQNDKKTLNDSIAKKDVELKQFQADKAANQPLDQVAATNTKKTELQVEMLQKALDESEKRANDAVIAAEVAKNGKLEAEVKQKSAERRSEDLEGRLLKANDPNYGKGIGSYRPVVDKDFKATIVSVDGDSVVISLGSNARLEKNSVLQIARYLPKAKFVGNITITSVDPYTAIGRFTPPATVVKPGPDDMPKVGDTVKVIE